MESTMPTLSEAAIRAGSAFYETAAAAREASSRADGLAASAAAAAGAATAPLASLQALSDAVKGSAEETGTALGGATVAAGDLGEAVGKAGGAAPRRRRSWRADGRGHPPDDRRQLLSWRGLSQDLGAAAPRRPADLEAAGAAADAGERSGGGDPVRFSPRPAQS